jgi:integrase
VSKYRIGRLNGRYVLVYYDAAGKRRRFRLNAKDSSEAHLAAPGIFAELTAPRGGRIEDLWNAFVAEKEGRAIIATMQHTWKALKKRFGQMNSSAVTVADCRAHMAERRAKGIKDSTLLTELGHLRMVLKWAEKNGHIARAPHIERPAQPKPSEKHLTKTEARALISAAIMPHVRLYLILALSTGARNTALLQLTWDRIDFDRGLIDLRNPELTTPHKGRAIVPMTNTVRAALLGAQPGALSEYVVEWGGQPVGSMKKAIAATGRRAKLGRVSPHMLRHSAAVHMAEDGVPMEEIAQFLGHSNLNITRKVYARFSPDYLRKAASALEYEDLVSPVASGSPRR